MQSLGINKQTVFYALYEGNTDAMKDGYKTGEKVKTYSNPVEIRMNVSAARGSVDTEGFGVNVDYDRTMVTSDMSCPITEESILWIGITPSNGNPHNYRVTKIAKSINSISYAIKEVNVR